MKFIPESIIDTAIEELGELPVLDSALEQMAIEQPTLLAYLTSENATAFSDSEKDFLFFATSVIILAIRKNELALPDLGVPLLTRIEEENYMMLMEAKGKIFRERITIFFEGYSQEDLLAFVEDALEEDEEELITKEGRDYLFVMLKTIIDAFDASISVPENGVEEV